MSELQDLCRRLLAIGADIQTMAFELRSRSVDLRRMAGQVAAASEGGAGRHAIAVSFDAAARRCDEAAQQLAAAHNFARAYAQSTAQVGGSPAAACADSLGAAAGSAGAEGSAATASSLVGMPRPEVEPGRYSLPTDEDRGRLSEAIGTYGRNNVDSWVGLINPHYGEDVEHNHNCGECARAFADALQDGPVSPASGDMGRFVGDDLVDGEYGEMWEWTGCAPSPASRWELSTGQNSKDFSVMAYAQVEARLTGRPVGTVAIIGVQWPPHEDGTQGGHWFNACVASDGTVWWADAQAGYDAPWPPFYEADVWALEFVTREPGRAWEG